VCPSSAPRLKVKTSCPIEKLAGAISRPDPRRDPSDSFCSFLIVPVGFTDPSFSRALHHIPTATIAPELPNGDRTVLPAEVTHVH